MSVSLLRKNSYRDLILPGDPEYERWRRTHPRIAGAANWSFGREVGKATSTTSATSASVTLSAGASVPAGNVVALWGMNNGGTINTNGISDSKNNTWTLEINTQVGGLKGAYCAWCVLTNTWTNTDTVTVNSSSTGSLIEQAIYVADFSPPAAGVVHDASNLGSSSSAASFNSGTVNTTGSDDLLLGFVAESGTTAGSLSPNAQTPAWTSPTTANQTSQAAVLAQWYALDAAAAAYSLNGTLSAASNYVAGVVALTIAIPPVILTENLTAPMRARYR